MTSDSGQANLTIMLVRVMIPDDALQVATVHTMAWQHAYHGILEQGFLDSIDIQKRTENWEKGIRENEPPIVRLVLENEGEILGFVCGLANRTPTLTPFSDCELWAIYVDPREFRRGVGKRLLDRFKLEMKLNGKRRLCIWVLEANHSARKFYESQGGILSSVRKEIEIGTQTLTEVAYEFIL